jgi:hypothetical protein
VLVRGAENAAHALCQGHSGIDPRKQLWETCADAGVCWATQKEMCNILHARLLMLPNTAVALMALYPAVPSHLHFQFV